jgi:hypothetical protein
VPPTPRRRHSLGRVSFSTHNSSIGAAAAGLVGAAAVLEDPAGAAPASVPVGVDPVRSGGAVRQFRRASSDSASESRRASFLLAREARVGSRRSASGAEDLDGEDQAVALLDSRLGLTVGVAVR